ncbi:hypothetical protein ACFS32_06395 [Novosphingobium pokkalii]|uniref:hypothetical protein n=1 Tax=Novosphingobium pokkalii TaxID=1770194 RepID=UPI003624E04C
MHTPRIDHHRRRRHQIDPSPTERTNPSSTLTRGTPSSRARAIRCGDTREGQIATAPPAVRALAKAKRGLRKKRKRCSGCHRKRRISARFHQAMPLATAIVRLAASAVRQVASISIASPMPIAAPVNGLR